MFSSLLFLYFYKVDADKWLKRFYKEIADLGHKIHSLPLYVLNYE